MLSENILHHERDDHAEVIYSKAIRAGKRTYFMDVKATQSDDYYLVITESRRRFNEDGSPNTAHSLNDVPFIVVNAGDQVTEVKDGKLADVAPTILKLMGIEQPAAMTGQPLV